MPLMDIITKEQVKFAKIAGRLTSEQIYKRAGIGKATLERFEAGNSMPSIRILQKIKQSVDGLLEPSGWELTQDGGIRPKTAGTEE